MNGSIRWTPVAALGLALAVAPSSAAVQEPDGAALYQQHCRSCHGATGIPAPRMVTLYPGLPNLADSAFLATRSTDSIVAVLRNGTSRKKAFTGKLRPEQMTAVAQFVKTLAAGAPREP